jgi:hypothetical protein
VHRRKFCIVENDLLLLASGVVMVACHLVNSAYSDQVYISMYPSIPRLTIDVDLIDGNYPTFDVL